MTTPVQIVFVGTEVAPWSKVGGLADVMSTLPAALAKQYYAISSLTSPGTAICRGHEVMSVAPRYEFYTDVKDTGLVVPLLGRVSTEEFGNEKEVRQARLHCCKRDGVDRVFVEHPSLTRQRLPRRSSPPIYPYTSGLSELNFEIGCSILCQCSIHAPFLIWNTISTNCGREEEREDAVGRLLECRHRLIFICNDWPCGILPIWLKYYVTWRSSLRYASSGDEVESVAQSNATNLLFALRDARCVTNQEVEARNRELAVALSLPTDSDDFLATAEEHQSEHISDDRRVEESETIAKQSKTPLLMECNRFNALTSSQIEALSKSKTVFLIHNMAFTGPSVVDSIFNLQLESYFAGIDLSFTADQGQDVSWLEAGIDSCDSAVTVSLGYAAELMAQRSSRRLRIEGIMNGIDTCVWNAAKDPFLNATLHYSHCDIEVGKNRAKLHLQRRLGLVMDVNRPLFGFVGRVDHQKGVDILLDAILHFYMKTSAINNNHRKAQFVLLGTGDVMVELHMRYIHYWFPGDAVGITVHSEALAHEVMAGCDFLIVPSRFEPCGLVARHALRYGTVPIAPAVGGLKDIVRVDGSGFPPLGIEVECASVSDRHLYEDVCRLSAAIEVARRLYGTRAFLQHQRRCMFSDVSWDRPVRQWLSHLSSLVQE